MQEKSFFESLKISVEKEKNKKILSKKKPVEIDFQFLLKDSASDEIENSIKKLVSYFQDNQIESIKLTHFNHLDPTQQEFFIDQLEQIAYPTQCQVDDEIYDKTPQRYDEPPQRYDERKQRIEAIVARNAFLSCYPKPLATENQPINLWGYAIDNLLPDEKDTVFNTKEINFFRSYTPSNPKRIKKINRSLLVMNSFIFPEYIGRLANQLNQNSSYSIFSYRIPPMLDEYKYKIGEYSNPYLDEEALRSLVNNSEKLRCFKQFYLDVQFADDDTDQSMFETLRNFILDLAPDQTLHIRFRLSGKYNVPAKSVLEFLGQLRKDYENNKHTADVIIDREPLFDNFDRINSEQTQLHDVIMQNRRQQYANLGEKPIPPLTELPMAYDTSLSPEQLKPTKPSSGTGTNVRPCKKESPEQRRLYLQGKMQVQHQVHQEVQQQKKIQRQEHIRQQLTQTIYPHINGKGLIDRNKFISPDNATSYKQNINFVYSTPPSLEQQLGNYWDTAFGQTPSKHLPFSLTPAANQQIIKFPYLFCSGVLDDTDDSLPEGFLYKQTSQGLVLDFDARHVHKTATISPFTVRYPINLNNYTVKNMGSLAQFNRPSVPEKQRCSFENLQKTETFGYDDLINIMQLVDNNAAEGIVNQHGSLLLHQLNEYNVHKSAAALAVEQGCQSVQKLLNNLQPIYSDPNSQQLFQQLFTQHFLLKNNIKIFLEEENRIIIEKISQLPDAQKTWWWTLVNQHMKAAKRGHLGDLFTAFSAFCASYQELAERHHLPSDLPAECNFENVTNLPVCLGRLDFILKQAEKAGNFAEQVNNLQGLDLGSQGAYYPMRYLDYSLVTPEMGWSQNNFALHTKPVSLPDVANLELPFIQPEYALHYNPNHPSNPEGIVITSRGKHAQTHNVHYFSHQNAMMPKNSRSNYGLYYVDFAGYPYSVDLPQDDRFIIINQIAGVKPPNLTIHFNFLSHYDLNIQEKSFSFELPLSEEERAYLAYHLGDHKVAPHDPEIYDGIIEKCVTQLEKILKNSKNPEDQSYLKLLFSQPSFPPPDHLQINLSYQEDNLLRHQTGKITRTSRNSKAFDQLMEKIASGFDITLNRWDIKKAFYRFVGEQKRRPPMAHFDYLFNTLMQRGEQPQNNFLAKQLLILLAQSSVNERAGKQEQRQELDNLLNFLQSQLDDHVTREQLIEIINFFDQTKVVPQFRFEEITALITGMLEVQKSMSMDDCKKLVFESVQFFGDHFARGVLNWADGHNSPTCEPISFQNYLESLSLLANAPRLTPQQKCRVGMSLGGVPSAHFNQHSFNRFLTELGKLPFPAIQAFTYVWSRLDMKEINKANSRPLILPELLGLVELIAKEPNADYQSIKNVITQYFGQKGYPLLSLEEITVLSTANKPLQNLKNPLETDELEKNWPTVAQDLPAYLEQEVNKQLDETLDSTQRATLLYLLTVKLLPSLGGDFAHSLAAIQHYLKTIPILINLFNEWNRINSTAFAELCHILKSEACVVESEPLMRLLEIFCNKNYCPPSALLSRVLNDPRLVGKTPDPDRQHEVLTLIIECAQATTPQAKALNEKLLHCTLGSLTVDTKISLTIQVLVERDPETAAKFLNLWESQLTDQANLNAFLNTTQSFFKAYREDSKQLEACLSYLLRDAEQATDLLNTLAKGKRGNPKVLGVIFSGLANQKAFDAEKIKEIIQRVKNFPSESQDLLLTLYATSPVPTLLQLHTLLSTSPSPETIRNFAIKFKNNPFGERNLAEQFDISQVARISEAIQDISPELEGKRNLSGRECQALLSDILEVNAWGHLYPYGENKPIKDLNDKELLDGWSRERYLVRESTISPEDKHKARLRACALAREIFFRASYQLGKPLFPNSTQMMALLLEVTHPEADLGLEISTGEGKSLIALMSAALATLEQDEPIDIHTPRHDLALRDAEKAKPFLGLLGENLHAALLELGTERQGNLAYATPAGQTLRHEEIEIEGKKEVYGTLIGDEGDFMHFEDPVHRRYAKTFDVVIEGEENPFAWIYPRLNEFIGTEQFQAGKTELEDVANFIHYLNTHPQVTLSQKRQLKLQAPYERLDQWLNSAYDASLLRPDLDYICKPALKTDRGSDGQPVPSQVTLLVLNDKAPGAEYECGVQQCLLSTLNQNLADDQASYKLTPEVTSLVSMTDHDFQQLYRRRIDLSGTLGSREQRKELAAKSPEQTIKMFRIPTHQPEKRTDRFVLVTDDNERKANMLRQVRTILAKGKPWFFGWFGHNVPPQPILIHCKNIQEAEELYALLKQELGNNRRMTGLQLYTAKGATYTNTNGEVPITDTENIESEMTNNAGIAGMITLSTLMKRGTHITPRLRADDETQTHPDGLAVFGHFASQNQMKQQIRRAARQGHPGNSTTYITCKELQLPPNTPLSGEALKLRVKTRQKALETIEQEQRLIRERESKLTNQLRRQVFALHNTLKDDSAKQIFLMQKWAKTMEELHRYWTTLIEKAREDENFSDKLTRCTNEYRAQTDKYWDKFCEDYQYNTNVDMEPLSTREHPKHQHSIPMPPDRQMPSKSSRLQQKVSPLLAEAEKSYLADQILLACQSLGDTQVAFIQGNINIDKILSDFLKSYSDYWDDQQQARANHLDLLTTQKMLFATIAGSESLTHLSEPFIKQQSACFTTLLNKPKVPRDFLRVYQRFIASLLPENSSALGMQYGMMNAQLDQYLSYFWTPEVYAQSARTIKQMVHKKNPSNREVLQACIAERKKIVGYALQQDQRQLFGFSLTNSRYHAYLDSWIERLELAISLDKQPDILNNYLKDAQNLLALALRELNTEQKNRFGLNAFNHFAANNNDDNAAALTITPEQIIQLNKLLRQQQTVIQSLPDNLRYLFGVLARQCEWINQYRNNEPTLLEPKAVPVPDELPEQPEMHGSLLNPSTDNVSEHIPVKNTDETHRPDIL